MRLEILALVLTAAVQDNEAEKLFRAMEAKFTKAKTVQYSFDATVEGSFKANLKGKIAIADANKARLEISGEFAGKAGKFFMVSDGVKSKASHDDGKPKEKEEATPKNLGKNLRAMTRSIGLASGLVIGVTGGAKKQEDDDFETQVEFSDFKLGAKEKIDGRPAQVLEFRVASKTDKNAPTATMRVWVDTEHFVPLKQIFSFDAGGKMVTVTQNNTDFRVDEKIDPKQFELPK